MSKNLAASFKKVAVLGAGVMGAQIAAHLANADVQVVLFELASDEGDANANVNKAIASLAKMEPAPLASKSRLKLIRAANYKENLEQLRDCDLIIEAIAERMDWKEGLFSRVAPYLNERAIFASNTSGLSINHLAKSLSEGLRGRFCGIHFFNPPRYMQLVELVPSTHSDPRILDKLESFLVTTLGKGVIRAKDTPNFIANRIGVFSMVATMHHGEKFGLSFDLIDALTGPAIGRPKSATYRTADVVGLDTLAHVISGSAQVLKDDPWHQYLKVPAWMQGLIDKGALGAKTKAGVFRKVGRDIMVLDPAKGDYVAGGSKPDAEVISMLKIKNPAEKFAALRASDHPQAQFLWSIHRDVFHYSAHLLGEIADTARDIDLAIRWGFGWKVGPFETWQVSGWEQVAGFINEDIASGKAMSDTALPEWVGKISAAHTPKGSYAPADNGYRKLTRLPVYSRQHFPETVMGEAPADQGETVFENDAVRMWHQGDGVAILSFTSKMHAVGDDVLAGIQEAIARAETDYKAMVIWHPEAPFSAGANLAKVLPTLKAGDWDAFSQVVKDFQRASQTLRYSAIPVVSAAQGLALGGGCEFLMHSDRVVAALESYVGLVEAGVGLIPAGAGCKEMALRADRESKGGDLMPFLKTYFETVAMAKVAKSAEEAKDMGFLRQTDPIIFNQHELLHVAKAHAVALAEQGYRPPLARKIRVAGNSGIATFKMILVNMAEGGFISEHDYKIGCFIAEAMCGGQVDPGTEVSEDWILRIEHEGFMELAKTEKTQARIEHMLKTGKPLRN